MGPCVGKIAKVIKGKPHFAEVEICLRLNGSGQVIDSCQGDGFQMQGYLEDATADGYADWKQAVMDEAPEAFTMASEEYRNYDLQLLRISGFDGTDTNPGIVACAARKAIWSALKYEPSQEDLVAINADLVRSWQMYHEREDDI